MKGRRLGGRASKLNADYVADQRRAVIGERKPRNKLRKLCAHDSPRRLVEAPVALPSAPMTWPICFLTWRPARR